MQRLGQAPKLQYFDQPTTSQWLETVTGRLNVYSGPADPTAAELPESQWVVYTNTSLNQTKIWANIKGVIYSISGTSGGGGGGTGDVVGPASAVSGRIPIFSGTSGKLIADSGVSLSSKQDTLVSGTNIKTINGTSLLGSGGLALTTPSYYDGQNGLITNTVANTAYVDQMIGNHRDVVSYNSAGGTVALSMTQAGCIVNIVGNTPTTYTLPWTLAANADNSPTVVMINTSISTTHTIGCVGSDDIIINGTSVTTLSLPPGAMLIIAGDCHSGIHYVIGGNLKGIGAQGTLISGTNIKTVNGTSLLGSGNIVTGTGDVTGPGVAVSGNLATFSGTTGKIIQDSGLTVSGSNTGDETTATIKTKLGITTLSGSNTGDQTITLTGDVTGSGTGSFAATIASGVVTLAKMANMATGSLFYRKTAGSGAPEVQTLATLKTDLGLTGTNSGDQTITLTGDVTGSGTGSFAATIGAGTVTLAKQANLAANSIIGNNTGAAATPIALTAAQTKTLLAIANTDVSGLGTMSTQNATAVAITGGTATGVTNFGLRNAGTGAFDMTQTHNGTLTAGRTLTWNLNDVARTISLSGNLTVSSAATISGTNTGDQTTITGNAGTATALQTARTINGVSFDGTANITVADATKEPTITAGTTAQYWRGDKSWQTLNAAAVGSPSGSGTSSGTNTGDETGARIATLNHAATAKTTLVDADEITGQDSAASFGLIRTTWTNVKVFLKTYFDTLYQAVLVSGTNIKTINSTSLLGSGNIVISGGASTPEVLLTAGTASAYTITPTTAIGSYTAGQAFWVKFHITNAVNPTLQISGLATPPNLVTWKRAVGLNGAFTNLLTGDIQVNQVCYVVLVSATQAFVVTGIAAEHLHFAGSQFSQPGHIASTGYVDKMVGNHRNLIPISPVTTLTEALHAGALLSLSSSTPSTYTLPATAGGPGCNNGTTIHLINNSTAAHTIQCGGSDTVYMGHDGLGSGTHVATSFTLCSGETATLVADAGAGFWWLMGGSVLGAAGSGKDKVFWENDIAVTTSYTINTNKNAMSAGPITINTGVTVTIPTGSTWSVV